MNPQARPCGVCHGPRTGIITETFADDANAFRRHAQLVRSGRSPSFCIRRDGTRSVCHFAAMAILQPLARQQAILTKHPYPGL